MRAILREPLKEPMGVGCSHGVSVEVPFNVADGGTVGKNPDRGESAVWE
jgi:hypothetical protein